MHYLSQLKSKDMAGKTCLLRINLDIKDPEKDSLRLEAVLPTIKFLLENDAKIIILSHRGRPTPEDARQINQKSEFSLEPLIKILQKKVSLILGSRTSYGSPTSLDWLENLRFDPREQANDENFAKELAVKGDFYVNDDFATSHRSSASMVGITKFLPSYAGLLLEKEIKNLSKVMDNPAKPLVIIIGGIKIDDKIGMIENFKSKADYFLMGSAYQISDFRFQISDVEVEKKVTFPIDFTEDNGQKFDIGTETVKKYVEIIARTKTIIWNGPLGKFEDPKYLAGSKAIAEVIIASGAFSVIGGGDTDQLLGVLGLREKFNFISTGGGAMLEFLSGKKLLALESLNL